MNFLKKNKVLVVIIILVIAGGSYYWYSKSKATTNQVRYVTATAEKGTLTSSISASGNVIVDQSSNIDPTITGTVTDLAVAVGDSVKKGQILFNIINGDLTVSVSRGTASLEQAENAVEDAEISVKSAKADYEAAKKKEDRTPDTYTNRQLNVLQKKIDSAEDGVEEAEQNLAAAQADYNNTLSDAAKRKVTAPLNGTVNSVNIKNGDDLSKVSSGSTRQVPIIIGDLGTMKAQVQVNEVDIASVSVGQKVMMKLDALANFETTGVVEKIDSLGTISSGVITYNVTINFDSLDPRIKPEMSVSSSIITDVKQNVLTVPTSAVKIQGGTTYVEVLNNSTPEQKDVAVGSSNSTDTEIVSGISAGDKVVTQTINASATTSSSTSSTNRTGGGGAGGLRIPGITGGGGRPD